MNVSGMADGFDLRGGIDFAQSSLEMIVKRDGNGVPLPAYEQDFDGVSL